MSENDPLEMADGYAVARPGDTVVVGFNHRLDDEELADIKESFEGFSQATGVHLALLEDVSTMTVIRGAEVRDGR